MSIETQTVTGVRARPGEFDEPVGSFAEFERRFGITESPEEDGLVLWDDLPADVDPNSIWTVVESDRSDEEYLVPGLQRFNRIGYVIAERPRADGATEYRTYCFG